jgi:hypothetical protein
MTQDFVTGLKRMIKANNKIMLELFEITKYDSVNKKISIKRPYEKTEFDNVLIGGVGLGNNKGVIIGYEVGEYVLVLDMMGQYVIVCSINNIFFPNKKDIQIWPLTKEIIIQTNALSRIKLKADGSFKLYNRENYGIECDANGNLILRGKTIKHTKTVGTW